MKFINSSFIFIFPSHDGVSGILTDKSTNHLTSKHGHEIGIDDRFPPDPNQAPTPYSQVRTRLNGENKQTMRDTLEEILQDPRTKPFPDMLIRGIKSHGYWTPKYGDPEFGFFVGIHTEGPLKGQIVKAQSCSQEQLNILYEKKMLD